MEYSKITEFISKIVLKDEICDFKDVLWERIESRCFADGPSRKVLRNRRTLLWRAAASITVVVMIALGIGSAQKKYSIATGELAIVLPDNSSATLYAGSSLKYNRITWLFRHTVSLSGKARFAGEHNRGFNVKTPKAYVKVLGTEFLVAESADSLHVECYSGSVLVHTPCGEQALREGEQVTCDGTTLRCSEIEKIWPEYVVLDNKPLVEALQLIEEIYGVVIDNADKYAGYTYSGVIPTGNIEEALELTLGSCNINYTLTENNVLIL